MPKREPIPRPRQLFPEVVAPLILLRRGLLRVSWWLREDHDWFPAWSVGAMAGLAGIMLAILLFFLDATNHTVVAKSNSMEPTPLISAGILQEDSPKSLVVPEVDEFPLDVSEDILPSWQDLTLDKADLRSSMLFRTRIFPDWKMNDAVTTLSRPVTKADQHLRDLWAKYSPDQMSSPDFRPYANVAGGLPLQPNLISPSHVITPFTPFGSSRNFGIQVEKVMPTVSSSGEPTTYKIHVTNTSNDPVDHVEIRERVSAIQRVADVQPAARVAGDELVWSLGRVAAEAHVVLSVTLVPQRNASIETESMIASTLQFGTLANVEALEIPEPETPTIAERSPPTLIEEPDPEFVLEEPVEDVLPIFPNEGPLPPTLIEEPEVTPEPIVIEESPIVTPDPEPPIPTITEQPAPFVKLKLESSKVPELHQGQNLTVNFTVTNVGTAVARDVTLYVELPPQFKHRFGNYVRHQIDQLEPKESRHAILRAETVKTGNGSLNASLKHGEFEEDAEKLSLSVGESLTRADGCVPTELRANHQNAKGLKPIAEQPQQSTQDDGWTATVIR